MFMQKACQGFLNFGGYEVEHYKGIIFLFFKGDML